MTIFTALLAILAFLAVFAGLKVVQHALGALTLVKTSTATLSDKSLTDDEKEVAVQKAGIALLGRFFAITWRVVASLAASIAPIYALAAMGFTTVDAVFTFLSRWDMIVVSTIVIGGFMFWSARKPGNSAYSATERVVHKLAFAAPFVQLTAADIEETMFAKEIAAIPDVPPIFITSLPRAGTTILLNAMHDIPQMATHTYRDMPFIMAPMLGAKFSSGFNKTSELSERAHGDGMMVGYDSPEAFEEVLWRAFWPKKFSGDTIELWDKPDLNSEATTFFKQHFRKIIALRCAGEGRYISKNNGNIARLDLIPKMFKNAEIIVPLRDPVEHVASLMRQHENFLDQHSKDPFVLRYMRDIGHLEFGHLHKPFDFPEFQTLADGRDPSMPDYWLAYWIAAYQHVTNHADHVHLVTQDMITSKGQATLDSLCEKIGVDAQNTDFAKHFHPVTARGDAAIFDKKLLKSARDVFAELEASHS